MMLFKWLCTYIKCVCLNSFILNFENIENMEENKQNSDNKNTSVV